MVGMAREATSNDIIQPTKSRPCQIEDDFRACFNGDKWTVEWWRASGSPVLTNQVGCYKSMLRGETRVEFEKEVERWIDEGILKPWSGKVEGILLLMAVVQPTEKVVRPVLDFRELNKYVACHTKDGINLCDKVMWEWWRMVQETKIVDLKSAYLQFHADRKQWQYQLVKYKGQIYCLTRLVFGLSSVPKIMTAVLKMVLAIDDAV